MPKQKYFSSKNFLKKNLSVRAVSAPVLTILPAALVPVRGSKQHH
jgi:hypothetical protein